MNHPFGGRGNNMKTIKKGLWIAASRMLMFSSRPGAAESSGGGQDSSSGQRYGEVGGMEATPQNPPTNEPAAGSATQTAAPAGQTTPPAQAQDSGKDKKDDRQPAQSTGA